VVVLRPEYENQMEGSLCKRTLHYYVTYRSIEALIGLLRYFFFFFAAFFFAAFFFFAIIFVTSFRLIESFHISG